MESAQTNITKQKGGETSSVNYNSVPSHHEGGQIAKWEATQEQAMLQNSYHPTVGLLGLSAVSQEGTHSQSLYEYTWITW